MKGTAYSEGLAALYLNFKVTLHEHYEPETEKACDELDKMILTALESYGHQNLSIDKLEKSLRYYINNGVDLDALPESGYEFPFD